MMRVIYETTEDCSKCLYRRGSVCMKLGKYLFDVCFERDCPLPSLEDVEQYTRYVTKDKGLRCHGNCRHWKHWNYNKALNTDIGICTHLSFKRVCRADKPCCEEFDEI